ncbi:YdeI/OmpD-associated family protein [Pedobacter mucosus]|uniref:YdeI/OmpD-associated family protein n=1 Tax=Pedobacter mucosus TaxID=2895286 RepID=UPI001EE49416|nr:YdeI/OmpD-associated family protein [Pedobacter mucosus]UKT64583.1 YdeI/OmpD-associated family protein [Pedobacter mucosus]
MQTSVQVDQYIANAAEFAIPILNHLRNLIHKADGRLEEKIKWGMPFFEYKGAVCHIAGFKNHCTIGFWKASLMNDEYHIFNDLSGAMGLINYIKSLEDLPADEILIAYVQQGIQLNEEGKKIPAKPKKISTNEVITPKYFLDALQEDPKALATFFNFSASNKREYISWLEEAKTESTKLKRLETAVEWIAEGKERMWKYKK